MREKLTLISTGVGAAERNQRSGEIRQPWLSSHMELRLAIAPYANKQLAQVKENRSTSKQFPPNNLDGILSL
jgi:hypothetical protein